MMIIKGPTAFFNVLRSFPLKQEDRVGLSVFCHFYIGFVTEP